MKEKLHRIQKIESQEHSDYRGGIVLEYGRLAEDFHLHWHSYYELEYFLGGMGEEILNDTPLPVGAGIVHLISPSDFHELRVQTPLELVKICFNLSDLDPAVLDAVMHLRRQKRIELSPQVRALCDRLCEIALMEKEASDSAPHYADILRRLLETLLFTLAMQPIGTDSAPVAIEKKGTVRVALAYVQANFQRPLPLSEVAEYMHLSPSHFCRCFHEEMGVSFVSYVRALRMELAQRLLLHTDSEVTDICYEVGFSSVSSFSAAFRRHVGLSPTEYRRGARRAPSELERTPGYHITKGEKRV